MNLIRHYFNEFLAYAKTTDFRQGLYVELSGTAIDILLLSILIPLLLWLLKLKKQLVARQMACFYTLQYLRRVVLLLLDLGRIKHDQDTLLDEMRNGKIDSVGSHIIYGNTENLLQILQIKINEKVFSAKFETTETDMLKRLSTTSATLLEEADKYIILFAAVGLDDYKDRFFEARTLIYPLKDQIDGAISYNGIFNRNMADIANIYCEYFSEWFKKEKRSPDRILKLKYGAGIALLLLKTPLLLLYRLVVKQVCKMLRRPYLDPVADNFEHFLFTFVLQKYKGTPDDLSNGLGVPDDEIQDFAMGYKRNSYSKYPELKERLGALFSNEEWRAINDEAMSLGFSKSQSNTFTRALKKVL